MNTPLAFAPILCLLAAFLTTPAMADAPVPAPGAGPTGTTSIPIDQLGAEAQKQYSGDGIGITPTADGATLRAQFQRLEGRATPEGLWLTSTADEDAGKNATFRVRAMAIQRGGDFQSPLQSTGEVRATNESAAWLRPHLIEEYRTSMDGIRQDFVVPARPPGTGDLTLSLELTGAHAEPAADGAKLIVTATGRELAYNRLQVTDANGRELEARLEVRNGGTLGIRVEDKDAAYPVRIDPTFSDADWHSLGVNATDDPRYWLNDIAVDAKGNLYAAGYLYEQDSRSRVTIAKWDGSEWSPVLVGRIVDVAKIVVTDDHLYFTQNGTSIQELDLTQGEHQDGMPLVSFYGNEVIRDFVKAGSKLYVVGSFTNVSDTPASNIACLDLENGTWSPLRNGVTLVPEFEVPLDLRNFPAGVDLEVIGNDLFVSGIIEADGVPVGGIARWDIVNQQWHSMGSGVDGTVYSLATNGVDLFIGGTFSTADGVAAQNVAKWSAGSWSVLGDGFPSQVTSLAASGNEVFAALVAGPPAVWDGNQWMFLGDVPQGPIVKLAVTHSGAFARRAGSYGALQGIYRLDRSNSTWQNPGAGAGFEQVTTLSVPRTSPGVSADVQLYAAGPMLFNNENYGISKWDGNRWNQLPAETNGKIRAIHFDNGYLYAGGDFTRVNGISAPGIARWDGQTWSALGSGLPGSVWTITSRGSDIYAGGSFQGPDGSRNVARWDTLTQTWSAMGKGLVGASDMPDSGIVKSLAFFLDELYAGGTFQRNGPSSVPSRYVARINSAGRLVDTVDLGAIHDFPVTGVEYEPNTSSYLFSDWGLSRLLPGGLWDAEFSQNVGETAAWGGIERFKVQPDGKIVVSGQIFAPGQSWTRPGLLRLLPDGTLDTTFNPPNLLPEEWHQITCLAVQPDGKVIVGTSERLFRLAADGTLDPTLPIPGVLSDRGHASAVLVEPDGSLLVAYFGGLEQIGAQGDPLGFVNLQSDFVMDDIRSMIRDADGSLLVCGSFSRSWFSSPSELKVSVLRFREEWAGMMVQDRSLPTIATMGGGWPDGGALDILLEPSGNILIVGSFDELSYMSSGIAKWNGEFWSAIPGVWLPSDSGSDPNAAGVTALAAIEPDSSNLGGNFASYLYAAGDFEISDQFGGIVNRVNVARVEPSWWWDPTGSLVVNYNWADLSLREIPPDVVPQTLAVDESYVFAGFGNDSTDGQIRVYDQNTGQWDSMPLFDPIHPDYSGPGALALGNGLLYVGGKFEQIGVSSPQDRPTWSSNVVALNLNTGPPVVVEPVSFAIGATSVTLGGRVLSGYGIVDRGVVYAPSWKASSLTLGDPNTLKVSTVGSIGEFAIPVSGLSPGTPYIYRAYATDRNGVTSYSDGAAFTTSSKDLELTSLTLSTGALNPAFDRTIKNYEVQVPGTLSSFTLTPAASREFQIHIRVNGDAFATVPSGTPSAPIPIIMGYNLIEVIVSTPDESVATTYNVVVARLSPPTLGAPTATQVTATSATLGGEIVLENGVEILERGVLYAATTVNPNPSIGEAGVTKVPVEPPAGFVLAPGAFSAQVTGLTPGTAYTYKAYARNIQGTSYTEAASFLTLSSNADLIALALSHGAIQPDFASASLSYSAKVSGDIASLTVTAVAAHPQATIQVRLNGGAYAPVPSGSTSGALALNIGGNTIEILVTAQDGVTTKTYTVAVSRLSPPSVTTPTVTAITTSTATLGGNVTSDGGDPITERGVVYAATTTNSDPLIGGTGVSKVTTAGTTGTFAVAVAGLTPATGYSFKAYAANGSGTSYTVAGTFTTDKATQTINFTDPGAKTYGDAPFALAAIGGGSGNPVTFSILNGPATVSGNTLTITGAGNVTVRASQAGDGSYYAAPNVDQTFSIAPKALTITAEAQSKAYGDADPALTYTTAGLQPGDNLTGALTRASGENVGTYAIAQGTLSAGSNYVISFTGANLAIGAKTLTITAQPQFKTYGDVDPALTYTSAGLNPGDSITGALARAAGESVGTYAITQGTLSAGSNYAIIFVADDLTIGPKTLTITAEAKSKTYGEVDPVLSYSNTGLQAGDNISGALSRTAGESVGTYAITQGTLSAGSNYAISFTGANLTIGAKTLTITAVAKSKVYGETDPALTYASTGLVDGDVITGSLTRTAGENVGTFPILQGSLSAGDNYQIVFQGADFTISAKGLTITADAKTKSYRRADPELTYTTTGLKPGDTITGALKRVAGENAGSYAIEQGTLAVNGNYEIAFTGALLTILPKALTVTADAKTKTYGDTDPVLTYSTPPTIDDTGMLPGVDLTWDELYASGGLLTGDSITGSLSRAVGENAGRYTISQGSLTAGPNYSITFTGSSLEITPKALTLTGAAVTTKLQDGTTDATITGTLSGVIAPDEVTFTGTGTFASASPGTGIAVTPAVTLGGAQAGNYVLTQPVGLTGTIAAGRISFASATYPATQADTGATLTLVRVSGPAATVTLRSDDGPPSTVPPFSAAVAGTDYTDIDGTTVSFAEGETTKTVAVTLIPKTAATTPNRRFSVTITSVTGGSIGDVGTALIQILANDTIKPTLTVTTPAANASVSDLSPFTVTGTAGDARGLDRVTVALNGGTPVAATLGASTSNASIPWSLAIQPVSGNNTLVVTAYDLTGNSTPLTRAFTFTRRYQLSVNRTAPAGVALDTAGTVAATPALTSGTAKIVPGTTVTLTATAKTGYVFTSWSGLPTGATALGNVATFAMPSADLTVSAAFQDDDVFTGPAGSGNSFQGLLLPATGTATNNGTVAYLSGTLTATGAFSGRILVDGLSQTFSASIFGDGSVVFTVGTAKQDTLSFGGRTLSLSYNAGAGNDALTATLTNGTDTSTGSARRAIYSALNLVPSTLLNTAAVANGPVNRGIFTVAFPAKAQNPAIDTTTYPQGEGYATLTLTDAGAVTGTGFLADGTAFTVSSALVSGNQCPIFAQLTTPGQAATVRGGSFLGTLVFDTTQANTDVAGTNLTWIRPDVTGLTLPTGATPAAIAAADLYTTGWPSGIQVDANGALYDKSKTVQAGIDLDGPSTDVNGATLTYEDGKLVLTGGKLSGDITKQNFIVSGNTITKLPSTDATFTLVPAASTGTFTGTFKPTWTASANPSFRGILLQKGTLKGGHGFFLSNATGDTDPEAGNVNLTLEPLIGAVTPVASTTPATVSTTSPYTLSGTAGNVRGVARVEIVLNGAAPVNAVLGIPNAAGLLTYSLPIEPAMGSNTAEITVVDLRGNRTSTTVTFIFNQRFPLVIARTVPTGINVDDAGTIAMTASPATKATALQPTIANSNPRTATVENGTPVTVTATPKAGYAFVRWTGLPYGANVTGNIATFNMPIAAVNLTAEFATSASVFGGVPGTGNSFFGLLRPDNGTETSNATVGFLSGTLNAANGAFTGTVLVDGVSQAINATFYGDGSPIFSVGTAKTKSLSFGGRTLNLILNSGDAKDQITASLTTATGTSSGVAKRAIYNATNAFASNGTYTAALPSKTQDPALDLTTYPQGDGFATLTFTNTGGVTITGTLADNTTFTATTALVDGNEAPFLAQILTPGSTTAKAGSLSGTLKIDLTQADSDLTGAGLLWIRPSVTQQGGSTPASLATQLYTDGWPDGIAVDVVGARYDNTRTVQDSLALAAVSPGTGNGKLQFADGKLTGAITKANFNINGSIVTKLPASDSSFTLTVTQSSGAFSGTIRPNWTPTATALPAFKGIILQKGANQGGFGFFLSNVLGDLNPESGGVSLSKP